MQKSETKEKMDRMEYGEGEALRRFWLDLKRLRDLIALCTDGFYFRQEAEFDVVVNVMESYENNVDEILKMVSRMAEKAEQKQKETER